MIMNTATIAVHIIYFDRSPIMRQYRATCTCGWEKIGDEIEVQSAAAVHDLTPSSVRDDLVEGNTVLTQKD